MRKTQIPKERPVETEEQSEPVKEVSPRTTIRYRLAVFLLLLIYCGLVWGVVLTAARQALFHLPTMAAITKLGR